MVWLSLRRGGMRGGPDPADVDGYGQALQLWQAVLADVTDEEAAQAAALWLRTDTCWWPTPGQLLAKVDAVQGVLGAGPLWGEILTCVKSGGGASDLRKSLPPPESSVAEAGIKALGGWWALRTCQERDLPRMFYLFRDAVDGYRVKLRQSSLEAAQAAMLTATDKNLLERRDG